MAGPGDASYPGRAEGLPGRCQDHSCSSMYWGHSTQGHRPRAGGFLHFVKQSTGEQSGLFTEEALRTKDMLRVTTFLPISFDDSLLVSSNRVQSF